MNRAFTLSLILAALAGPVSRHAPAAESWDLSPYKIVVLVAVDPSAAPSRDFADELRADLPARAAAAIGGAWQLEAQVAPVELRLAIIDRIGEVTRDQLPAEALKADKVILLAVSGAGGETTISARELDVTTGLWNTVVTRRTSQPRQIVSETFRTVVAAFAPLARIESTEGGVATLRLKAGAIAPRDRGASPANSGAAFRPVLTASDAAGNPAPNSARPIDWTWLTVTSAGGPIATCRIDTGVAGEAIPPYHPRRLRLALAVTPPQSSTRLVLTSGGEVASPLEGVEVLAQSPDAAAGDGDGQPLGISDRTGVVTIPPVNDVAAGGVRIIVARRGSQQLARAPIVPGLQQEIRLVLPDDRQRLAIEMLLDEVQDGLIDLAARRQALATRIKLARKSNEAGLAEKLTPKLRGLSGVEPLTAQLGQAEKLLTAADPQTQSLVKPRLDGLRKLAQDLAAQSPQSLLEDPKPVEATK